MDASGEVDRVRRAQNGDRAAFEDLIRATARLVWASVYGMVRDPAWTEDLVQETFLKAWESIGELRDPAAFRGWLMQIARRLAWRHAEVAGRSIEPPEPPKPATHPEEAREAVQDALARLPERYRLPVTLHLVNGMDYRSISQSTGLQNGALRGLIARGIAKLRAELTPWWRERNDNA